MTDTRTFMTREYQKYLPFTETDYFTVTINRTQGITITKNSNLRFKNYYKINIRHIETFLVAKLRQNIS